MLNLKDRYWQRTVPPVDKREKLWLVRARLHFNVHWRGPYKSPWLPKVRRPKMRKEIHLNRTDDEE